MGESGGPPAVRERALTILQQLDTTGYPAPSEYLEFFYRGSIGCVGILKDWLIKAHALAAMRGVKKLELQHLRATRHSAKVLQRILLDIQSGEHAVGSDDSEVNSLFDNLPSVPLRQRRPTRRAQARHPQSNT
jgi:hypothetical protein